MNQRQPRIFIASSTESLDVANAVNVSLDHEAEVTVWKDGFTLSQTSIDSLVKVAETVDFAVFIFTRDDVALIRGKERNITRDNVLFELGLFIGTIGQRRCIIVKPRDEELHFPSDLLGITHADYNGKRSDCNLSAAINTPCTQIRNHMREVGLREDDPASARTERKRINLNYRIRETEVLLLAKLHEEGLGRVSGLPVSSVFQQLRQFSPAQLTVALTKLERLGHVDRRIEVDDHDGREFFSFHITADGIELLLASEETLFPAPALPKEDIPF